MYIHTHILKFRIYFAGILKMIRIIIVTESQKMVPNHTFLFHYICYCNMKSNAFSTLFHIITWNLMLKLSKLCNKYSGNTYTLVEIQLNICRNTMDFMCDLEPFSEIWSQLLPNICDWIEKSRLGHTHQANSFSTTN